MPDVNKTVLSLQDFLPYRLSVLSNRISRALAERYQEEFNITRPQWRVIAILGEHSPIAAYEVTERTAMDKVAVSRAVNGLVEKKLVKQQSDGADKRRSQLSLTATGKKTYNAVIPVAQAYENKLMAQLTETEQKQLLALLNKLDTLDLEADAAVLLR